MSATATIGLALKDSLPGFNGFEVLEKLDYQPAVIFTTAYDEYALKAFEVHAIDYLVSRLTAEDRLLLIDDVFDSGRSLEAVVAC